MEERKDVLGFTPQKEIPYNKLLPYSDKLDAESNEQLGEIKANLARTIQLRDVKIGASHWTGQLSKCVVSFPILKALNSNAVCSLPPQYTGYTWILRINANHNPN